MRYISLAILLPFLLLSFASQASAQAVFPNRGGTGTTVIPSYGQVLIGNSGGTYNPTATSSLGLAPGLTGGTLNALTYWTGGSTLGATTSPTVGYLTATSTTASSTFQGLQAGSFKLGTFSGVLKAINGWITGSATTDDLPEGSSNRYWTDTRFDNRLSATTSLPGITALTNLGTVRTSLTGILKATAGVLSTALVNLASDVTGILGIANGGTGTTTQVTNGVNFYDGTKVTSGTVLTFDGAKFGVGTSSPNTTLNIYSPQSASGATQFEIDDGTTGGFFSVGEGTSNASAYIPTFTGRSAGINGFGLSFSGQIPVANDTPFNSQNLDGAILFTASRVGGAGLSAANVFNVRNGGSSYFLINAAGKVGIGTTTPAANLQVTTITANATSSLQVGKANQNKGSCLTYYDTAGTPVYMYFAAGSTAPTYTSTQPSGCGN